MVPWHHRQELNSGFVEGSSQHRQQADIPIEGEETTQRPETQTVSRSSI